MKTNKMNKKGFLFTFITIFMLFALVVLSYDYLERNKSSQDLISSLSFSNRLNFMRENIVSDYFSMLDITLDEITRDENYIILRFSNFSTIKENSTYPNFLQIQRNFTQNHFSRLSNVNILLQNYIPEFLFYPYNSTFVIDNRRDSSNFFIYIEDYNRFNGMEIDIRLNNSIANLNSTSVPISNSDKPYLSVNVFDVNDDLIMSETVFLNSTTENQPFQVAFNKIVQQFILPTFSIDVLQNVTFSYGRFREISLVGTDILTDATFNLQVTGLEAHISRLELNYTSTTDKAVLMTKASVTLR